MKRAGYLFCILSIVFTMLSCSTAGTVWDDSVPPEQSAKIVFTFLEPKSYNQINVNKKDFAIVTIPAGPIEIVGDIVWFSYSGNTRYDFRAKDAVFFCELEGGKEYWAIVDYKDDDQTQFRTWGISLYNDEIKARVGFPGKDKLVGFFPFNPPVLSVN